MNIFVLTQEVTEDGAQALLGVYASLEEARDAAEQYDPGGGECLMVWERQLGAAAVFDETFVECI